MPEHGAAELAALEESKSEADLDTRSGGDSSPGKRNIYDRVDTEKRKRLLHLVDVAGVSIKAAARQLGINYSTAKTILQLYRRSGRIERLPHHKSFKSQDLRIRIPLELRARPKYKARPDDDDTASESSFCTTLLVELARRPRLGSEGSAFLPLGRR